MAGTFTKQRIWEAFYELSAVVPFEKLTVEQIIEYCGVSKATFYRHFRDKYDVLNYNSMAIVERIVGGKKCKDWQEFLLHMFMEIEQEMEYYKKAFKTSGQNAHPRFLYEYSYGIVRNCYMRANSLSELTQEEHYMIAHYCHGCVSIIAEWLKDPARPSAEKMAEISYSAMPKVLRGTWLID